MESPGFLMVLYLMYTLPGHIGLNRTLPKENLFLGGLYVTHYLYRAILYPLLNPSMSPMHVLVWASAFLWQLANGISIGGFLGGYGPTTAQDWAGQNLYIECGLMLWIFGFALNIWHDDELREIRRAALRRQKKDEKDVKGKTVDKVYYMPKNGLFWVILYPHYLMEWVEWFGWWMMAGWGCVPARNFVINEITTMLPRAIQGRRWYIEKFGREKVGSRKAVIPGLI
jgi:3-oxo-5-alpha-steroid 4-dehydrogenase 1